MWQFIFGSHAMFANLEQRAKRVCVRFRDQELPPGSSPSRAAIGFEIDPTTGLATLLVDYGVTYIGPNDEVRSWFDTGERCFESFADLREWLGTAVRLAFNAGAPRIQVDAVNGRSLQLDEVQERALRLAIARAGETDDLPS